MEPLLPDDVMGAWGLAVLPFDARGRVELDLLGAQVQELFAAGLEGLHGGGASGELAGLDERQAHAVHALLVELGQEAGLPVVLDASGDSLERALARLEASGELEPAGWLVRPPSAPPGGASSMNAAGFEDAATLDALARLAAAAAPASLLLEEPHPGALDASSLARCAQAVPQVVGARILPRAEEGWAELAPVAEDLALLAAGREWASAHRWGARAGASELACLFPAAAAGYAELLEEDIQQALRLERRLQRFLEAQALPALPGRAPSPALLERLLVLVGGWCDLGGHGWRGRSDELALDPAQIERVRPHAESLLAELAGSS